MSESAMRGEAQLVRGPSPTLKLKRKRRRLRPPSLPSEKLKERGQMHPSSTLARRTDRYKEQPQSAIEVKCISVCVFAGCPHGIIHTE